MQEFVRIGYLALWLIRRLPQLSTGPIQLFASDILIQAIDPGTVCAGLGHMGEKPADKDGGWQLEEGLGMFFGMGIGDGHGMPVITQDPLFGQRPTPNIPADVF